jgi:transcriptional regulator with XRE-family HTH domain
MFSAMLSDWHLRAPLSSWLAYGTLIPAAFDNAVGEMVMPLVSHPLTLLSTGKVSGDDNAPCAGLFYARRMKNHLRAWREFRNLSQEQVADRLGTAKGVISLLENGKRPLSDKWLHKLAEVLETRPGHLLDLDPNELDNDIIDIWAHIDQRDRVQAVSILRTFMKTGTDNKS